MKLLIIRHGDPDYTIDSLTEKGFREAELLKNRLVKLNIDAFYCSPLGRARATAKPTLEAYNADAVICDWLREFDGYAIDPESGNHTYPWDRMPRFMSGGRRGGSVLLGDLLEQIKNISHNILFSGTHKKQQNPRVGGCC